MEIDSCTVPYLNRGLVLVPAAQTFVLAAMTKLCELLGSRPEVVYECMYTKHKTQKRKIWQDGFVALYPSRRLVLYDDAPPGGKVIDEANVAAHDWDFKDEEVINVPKFLVEIIDTTPVGAAPPAQEVKHETSNSNSVQYAGAGQRAPVSGVGGRPGALGGRPRFANNRFRTPLSRGPSQLARPGAGRVGQPLARSASPSPPPQPTAASFDFDRNPTSEWNYEPNAIRRTPDEVLALLEK